MKKYCYEIFAGVKDQNDMKSHYGLEEIKERFRLFASKYGFPFSLSMIHGGYRFKSGGYVFEDCLHITIVSDLNEDRVDLFCQGVKKIFNQESVLVIRNKMEQKFI